MTANKVCPFPLTADRACGRTVVQRSGPGRPRIYCDDPKHNAVARLRADERFRARAQHGDAETARPVTERVSALGAALDRLGNLKAELRAELTDAEELAADLTDLDLVATELRAVEAAAEARVAQARAAQAAAEHDAALARRERDAAHELTEIALDAAEEAIATRDASAETVIRIRQDCDQQIARVTAVDDAALIRANAERERLRVVADTALNELREELSAQHDVVAVLRAEHAAELATLRTEHHRIVATLTTHAGLPAHGWHRRRPGYRRTGRLARR
ncbi:hypothetical protein F5X71_00240 [Nocardia brasiliensis]|uniref:Uncharacterized protein n=1 Tax=Nocardia brasiliensis TaxID=37326 RepID=A0A6G9XJ78_NOCBR|nr:hypothetical protein [Nocardia brasiliensis]QIS00964.1 hypothetical protein F5X71_00240 [Nocardia brasiliensis]